MNFIDAESLAVADEFDHKAAIRVFMVASMFSGKGVTSSLLQHVHARAVGDGFKVSVAECTVPVSQHIFAKDGYCVVKRFPYAEFLTTEGCPIVSSGECHFVLKHLA